MRGSAPKGIAEEEHPEIGAKLVQPLGFEKSVADAILHHHEYWNGDGYPHGLAGDEIPLASRVIAVVDAFDKITSGDGGEEARSAEEARCELQKHAGTRFDPALVTAFVSLLDSRDFDLPADDSE